jgi:hypothetical protein
VAAPPAERDRGAAANQRLENRQPSRRVDKDIGRREPVGHCFRKALDPHAFLRCEPPLQAPSQLVVTTAQADNEPDLTKRERDLDRGLESPDAPPAARHEHDLSVGRKSERRAGLVLSARLQEGWVGEASHALRRRRAAGDLVDLVDRFGVRDEVDVGARRRPVPQCGQVRHCCAHRNMQAAASTQSAEYLGRVRIGRDDHIRLMCPNEVQEPGSAEPGQSRLREAPGRPEACEEPEPGIPKPAETEEDHPRRAFTDGGDRPPHHRKSVHRDYLDLGALLAKLGGKHPRRKIVTLADAGGHDQDPRRHYRIVRSPRA